MDGYGGGVGAMGAGSPWGVSGLVAVVARGCGTRVGDGAGRWAGLAGAAFVPAPQLPGPRGWFLRLV